MGCRVLLLCSLLMAGGVSAQVGRDEFEKRRQQMREQFAQQRNEARRQYDEARKKAEAEYAAFRQKANEEYAAAMQQAWDRMVMEPAVPRPKEPAPPRPPKPPKPPKPVPGRMPEATPLPQGEVVLPPTSITPLPLPSVPEPPSSMPTMEFVMYGTSCNVHAEVADLRFSLPSLEEKKIAAVWKQLSQEKYDGLLHDCMAQREALRLSDWGYVQLLGRMSEQLLGKGSNEAVLLQMYLLAQSGYRVRIANSDGHLVLLMPFNRNVYNYSYLTIDGIRHYAITPNKITSVNVCGVAFPREQVANILMGNLPDFGSGAKRSRTLKAEQFATLQATVEVDQRLIDYLNEYPLNDAWEYYSLAGLSEGVKATLYPALRSQIEGKSKKKAALMLLDFVQTGFEYSTDQDQFGYERPLFGDESLYYPKNDCEDRSIFYSILVRDLLGLDVVLVQWPGHLSTAVAFPEEIDGDYFTVDGRRYTVCDPTYIGAPVGETMPQFQGVSANLVRL